MSFETLGSLVLIAMPAILTIIWKNEENFKKNAIIQFPFYISSSKKKNTNRQYVF
jgi:hypothetical protein